jgi:hypothetical protein
LCPIQPRAGSSALLRAHAPHMGVFRNHVNGNT